MRSCPGPASLLTVLTVTALGSVAGGTFWAGLFFVTAERYRFSALGNLALAAAMGGAYAAAAGLAGQLARGRAPRRVLSISLAISTAAMLLPMVFSASVGALWIGAVVGVAASAATWPIVESYLTAGRHGAEMRSAIGKFNVTWTPATALPLVVLPLVTREGPSGSFAVAAGATVLAWVAALRLPPHPAPHEPEGARATVGAEYPPLLRSASWLLAFSYVVSSTLAPVLPQRLADVGVGGAGSSFIASAWMAMRFLVLFAMWRTHFWHGRWGTLATAAASLGGGLAMVLLARTLPVLVVGLLVYGAAMGLTYYASLYYAMAVGHGAVDAGGKFEALIGLGYCVGPLLGIAGNAVAGPTQAGRATIALTWMLAAVAARGVVLPYLRARKARRGH
jgi:hypothetical protein